MQRTDKSWFTSNHAIQLSPASAAPLYIWLWDSDPTVLRYLILLSWNALINTLVYYVDGQAVHVWKTEIVEASSNQATRQGRFDL